MRHRAAVTALALLVTACRHNRPISSGFEDIYPRAKAAATTTVRGQVGGADVTVHAGPPFAEDDARRFIQGLEGYQEDLASEYALLRSGLERHLGPELMARVDRTPVLKEPDLPTEWYLLGGEWPGAIYWKGPRTSTYHIVRGPEDPFLPRSTLRFEVHSKTHFIIRNLGVERPAVWPRWLEEGLAEWNRLQFARMKDGTWDGDADVLARLVWQRGPIRERLMRWRNPKGTGYIDARFEPDWESDLLYKGALGAVLALDQELPGGAVGLIRELARALPDEDEVLRVVEEQLGHALGTMGRMSPQARVALRESMITRARAGELPAVRALGQFPEAASEVAELLITLCHAGEPETVIAAATGLRYLGDRRLLERTVDAVEQQAGQDLRAALAADNRWAMAAAYARSGREGDWYGTSAPTGYMGTGPGTGLPSRSPSTSPTR